jgi:hypothetical protein
METNESRDVRTLSSRVGTIVFTNYKAATDQQEVCIPKLKNTFE